MNGGNGIKEHILAAYPELHELCHQNATVRLFVGMAVDGRLTLERALVEIIVGGCAVNRALMDALKEEYREQGKAVKTNAVPRSVPQAGPPGP